MLLDACAHPTLCHAHFPSSGTSTGCGTYLGTNRHVAPGALLALPAAAAAAVKTVTAVGGKIKRALVDYGGYIVDGSGSGPAGGS